ncbi:protein of unknown function [Cupriavidus taiwanensis]|nr:protein of unknown function [Cupriavidus taiwanensis]
MKHVNSRVFTYLDRFQRRQARVYPKVYIIS